MPLLVLFSLYFKILG